MLILVTNAIDGERFLLNTAFVRSIHPAQKPNIPNARTVAVYHDDEETPFWLTENVAAIDCLSRGEIPSVDVQGLREKLEAAISEQNRGSAEY